ncbi:hypothetical protein BJY00DRAFT_294472 [Aspergillus carlsbadensis]|nr:hypothetical protein BJY00DRAFT_294472 [Aspergillus carlsbadensis]
MTTTATAPTTSRLPDLVADSRLVVEIHETHTDYFNIRTDASGSGRPSMRRNWKKETWTRTKRLGGGATGDVWLEECRADVDGNELQRQLQAVKVVSKSVDFDVYAELETIAKFSQRSSKYEGLFVKSLGWYENERSVFIVMEHIQHGSLASHLTEALPEDQARDITTQILEGLACLHENEFVHRDLKPENILVASKPPNWWVKIGDFGFSKRHSGDNSLHTLVGTRNYLAPEVLGLVHPAGRVDATGLDKPGAGGGAGNRYRCTYAMDLWSMGVTVFYMLCHEYPFQGPQLVQYLGGGDLSVDPLSRQRVSEQGCAFVKALLVVDPSNRLTAVAALGHPWLADSCAGEIPGLLQDIPLQSVLRGQTAAVAQVSGTQGSVSWPMGSTWGVSGVARMELPGGSRGAVSDPEGATQRKEEGARDAEGNEIPAEALDEPRLLHQQGLQCMLDGNYDQAASLFEQAAAERKKLIGPRSKDTLASLQQLGIARASQGRYQDAQDILQPTATIQAESLGASHADTLETNHWLSTSLTALGQLEAALEVNQRATEIQKLILGSTHADTVRSLRLGGKIRYRQGRSDEALALFGQATEAEASSGVEDAVMRTTLLPRARKLYQDGQCTESLGVLRQIIQASSSPSDPAPLLDLLSDLGGRFDFRSQYEDAQYCFEKVLDYRRELLGSTHPRTFAATIRVASILCKEGVVVKTSQAHSVLHHTLQLSPSKSVREDILDQLHRVGEAFWHQRAYSSAHSAFTEVHQERKVLHGEHDRRALQTSFWVGLSLVGLGQYSQATTHLTSVLKAQEATGGAGHDLAQTNLWLGHALHYEGNSDTAHPYICQAMIEILREKLGVLQEDTLVCMRCLGSSYGLIGDYALAEQKLRQVAEHEKRMRDYSPKDANRTQINLGITLYGRKKHAEALDVLSRARDAQSRAMGATLEDTLATQCYIAATLDAQKRYAESEREWRAVADARRAALGMTHADTQAAARSLGLSLEHQGKWTEAKGLHEEVLEARRECLGDSHRATVESGKDIKRCNKGMTGKWFLSWPSDRMKVKYQHL